MVIAYTVGCAIMLAAFKAAPNVAALQWLLVAGVGFMLYGPQMLVGLCGAETVARPAVSACQGFLGWISYLGNPSRSPFASLRVVPGGPGEVEWLLREQAPNLYREDVRD